MNRKKWNFKNIYSNPWMWNTVIFCFKGLMQIAYWKQHNCQLPCVWTLRPESLLRYLTRSRRIFNQLFEGIYKDNPIICNQSLFLFFVVLHLDTCYFLLFSYVTSKISNIFIKLDRGEWIFGFFPNLRNAYHSSPSS